MIALQVVSILAALAGAVVWLPPTAQRHIAWWLLARAMYLDNIRAEKQRWRDYCEARRQEMADEFYREATGPVAVREEAA